jgi:hypothetical protein
VHESKLLSLITETFPLQVGISDGAYCVTQARVTIVNITHEYQYEHDHEHSGPAINVILYGVLTHMF